ncbi:MAG: tetratricopeptide repeat protein [Alphaproteobacteria bacterium]|nr:tetratricopeptide repeat protein [Alphaproteobacteria bacterium]
MGISLLTIYGALLALTLVTTDTLLNTNTLYIEAHVASQFETEGYSPAVVQEQLINELTEIADTKSLIKAPVVKSSDAKSFSAGLASVVSLEDSLKAAQNIAGLTPPRLFTAAVINDGRRALELTGRSHVFERFSITVEGKDKTTGEMFKEAAYKTFTELDPYIAILYRFTDDRKTTLSALDVEIDGLLERLKYTPHNDDRSHLLNLKGIIALDANDVDGAVALFRRSIHADPTFLVARLNLALSLIQLDRYQEAIDEINRVTEPWWWRPTGDNILLATAYTIRGVGFWGQGKLDRAGADFQYAAVWHPTSTAAYWYWSRLIREMGDTAEADRKLATANDNLAYFEGYPEVALLYFWVSEEDARPLERRSNRLPSWAN